MNKKNLPCLPILFFVSKKMIKSSDVKEEGYTNLFAEDCNQHVENSIMDDFKEDFSQPIYDEYEDDYLDNEPKQLPKNFTISGPVSEYNLIAIHDQNSENRVDSKHAEGGCLPLCFSSFEMLKQRSKDTYKKHKFEVMENFINFLKMDN